MVKNTAMLVSGKIQTVRAEAYTHAARENIGMNTVLIEYWYEHGALSPLSFKSLRCKLFISHYIRQEFYCLW